MFVNTQNMFSYIPTTVGIGLCDIDVKTKNHELKIYSIYTS